MKKLSILLLGVLLIGLTSCKKTYTVQSDPYTMDLTKLPSTFQQNVLFETYTATWCGYCPREPYELDPIVEAFPGRVFIAAMHQSDEMSNTQSESLASTFNVSGIPDAHCNRNGLNYFTTGSGAYLNTPTHMGVAIVSSVSGNTAKITVCAGFTQDYTQPLALTVYVTEDGLSYPQHNYYNTSSQYPELQGAGDIIDPYTHYHVFRRCATTAITGDAIPASSTMNGKIYSKSYSVDITGFNAKKMHVIAMINKQGGINAMNDGLFNVQSCNLGSSIGWK